MSECLVNTHTSFNSTNEITFRQTLRLKVFQSTTYWHGRRGEKNKSGGGQFFIKFNLIFNSNLIQNDK